MPGDGGGNLPPSTVDGYFQGWIDSYKNGTDNQHGHIVLEHELNNATVSMAEKWLPQLQETFNVVPVHECMNISNPYWEENFVYPTEDNSTAPSTAASSALSTAPGATAQSASSSGSSGSNDNSNSNSDASESSTSSSTSAANASYNLAFGSMVFTAVVAVCFF
jgi:cobalamin biosynthesis Mg chelatase CobN